MTTSASDTEGTGRRAGLDRDDVIDAALTLVESGGANALTMRKLAADLGVTTTTIYWHVGGRDELIIALIQRLSEQQADVDIEGDDARARVMSVARHVWRSALEHRNVTALAHQVGATSLLEMNLEIALARELVAAGLAGEDVRDALRGILLCIAGFLVVALKKEESVPPEFHNRTLWAGVSDTAIDPGTLAALRQPPDLPSLFETTLQGVIDSLVPERPDTHRRPDA